MVSFFFLTCSISSISNIGLEKQGEFNKLPRYTNTCMVLCLRVLFIPKGFYFCHQTSSSPHETFVKRGMPVAAQILTKTGQPGIQLHEQLHKPIH
jgi:hypothetical protein